jgi:hypothetical protein
VDGVRVKVEDDEQRTLGRGCHRILLSFNKLSLHTAAFGRIGDFDCKQKILDDGENPLIPLICHK